MTVIWMMSVLAAFGVRSQEPPIDAKVKLEVVLIVRNGQYQLTGILKSGDIRPFVLQSSQLPWGEGRSLYLDTFIPDSRGAKLGRRPYEPPPRGEITLEAGGSLSGELNLSKVLVGLERMARVHPVIIQWAYQFKAADDAAVAQWQAGSFVIPKGGLPEGATLH